MKDEWPELGTAEVRLNAHREDAWAVAAALEQHCSAWPVEIAEASDGVRMRFLLDVDGVAASTQVPLDTEDSPTGEASHYPPAD